MGITIHKHVVLMILNKIFYVLWYGGTVGLHWIDAQTEERELQCGCPHITPLQGRGLR